MILAVRGRPEVKSKLARAIIGRLCLRGGVRKGRREWSRKEGKEVRTQSKVIDQTEGEAQQGLLLGLSGCHFLLLAEVTKKKN